MYYDIQAPITVVVDPKYHVHVSKFQAIPDGHFRIQDNALDPEKQHR
jgi:hypothetical protein